MSDLMPCHHCQTGEHLSFIEIFEDQSQMEIETALGLKRAGKGWVRLCALGQVSCKRCMQRSRIAFDFIMSRDNDKAMTQAEMVKYEACEEKVEEEALLAWNKQQAALAKAELYEATQATPSRKRSAL